MIQIGNRFLNLQYGEVSDIADYNCTDWRKSRFYDNGTCF